MTTPSKKSDRRRAGEGDLTRGEVEPRIRFPGPISEEEVATWASAMERAAAEDESTRPTWQQLIPDSHRLRITAAVKGVLRQSLSLLEQPKFRAEFSDLLYGDSLLAYRGFTSGPAGRASRFMKKWSVLTVIPPVWDGTHRGPNTGSGRWALAAPFPVPITLPRPTSPEVEAAVEQILKVPRTPLPRSRVPLAQEEILWWAAALRTEIRNGLSKPIDPRWQYVLEQSVEHLLNREFRDEFSKVLATGMWEQWVIGTPEASEAAQRLRKGWGVFYVELPKWDPSENRYAFLAPFPLPFTHLQATKDKRAQRRRAGSNRLFVAVSPPLNPYPVYTLTCTDCYVPQGPVGFQQTYKAWEIGRVPSIRDQARTLAEGRRRRRPRSPMARLAGSITEEIWGLEAADESWGFVEELSTASRAFVRLPVSGLAAEVLDLAIGVDSAHEQVQFIRFRSLRWWVRLMAAALSHLICPVCGSRGSLRFSPTINYPLACDLAPLPQRKEAERLSRFLRAARSRVRQSDPLQGIFWCPDDVPRMRSQDVAKRIETSCRKAGFIPPGTRDESLRLCAGWLIRRARAGDSTWTDAVETEAMALAEEWEHEHLAESLGSLREDVLRVADGKSSVEGAQAVADLLRSQRYRRAEALLIRVYARVNSRLVASRKWKSKAKPA